MTQFKLLCADCQQPITFAKIRATLSTPPETFSATAEGVYITDIRSEAVIVQKGISGKVQCGRCKKVAVYHLDKIER